MPVMTQEDAERILRSAWQDYVGPDHIFHVGVLEYDWGSMQIVIAARAIVAAYEAGTKVGKC